MWPWLAALSCSLFIGCSTPSPSPSSSLDLSLPDGSAAPVDMASSDLAPASVVFARIYALDLRDFAAGVSGYLEGYPQSASPPSMAGVTASIPVPADACGKVLYTHFTGQVGALPVLHTVRAPAVSVTCPRSADVRIAHVLLDDPGPKGIRTTIARELAAHGDIPMADGASGAAFGAHWSWALARMLRIDDTGEFRYVGGTISVDPAATECRRFYLHGYQAFVTDMVTTYVDFSATTSTAGFVLVCPRTRTTDVTLTAGGFTDASDRTPATFGAMPIPMVPDGVVSLDWGPTTF